MPQGGFSRDFQRATVLRTEAEKRKEEKQRERIGQEVIQKLDPYFKNKIKEVEEVLILKQDETIDEFVNMMKSRNVLLKYLLWTNFVTLLCLSFVLGYFL